jgi:hypothetical protein
MSAIFLSIQRFTKQLAVTYNADESRQSVIRKSGDRFCIATNARR